MRIANDSLTWQHFSALSPQRKARHSSITQENAGGAAKLDDTMKLIEASKGSQNTDSLSADMRLKLSDLDKAQSADNGIAGVTDKKALNELDNSLHQLKSLANFGARDDITDADRTLCQQEFNSLVGEINDIGRESDKHTAAVMTESAKQTDDKALEQLKQRIDKLQNRSWANMLNLKGLGIATTQDAQSASLVIDGDIQEVEWRLGVLGGGYTAKTGTQSMSAAEQAGKAGGNRDAHYRTLAMLRIEQMKGTGSAIFDQLGRLPSSDPDDAAESKGDESQPGPGEDVHP